jgi:hypothetical protein
MNLWYIHPLTSFVSFFHQEGLFFSDNPSSAKNAISVGSVDAQEIVAGHFKASTGKELVIYRTSTFNLSGEHPIYITANSTDVTTDACDELPKNTPNLTDYVVLVRRGYDLSFFPIQDVHRLTYRIGSSHQDLCFF